MKSFLQYTQPKLDELNLSKYDSKIVLHEADTSAAYEMEKVIVDGANDEGVESKYFPNAPEIGKKIVKTCGLKGKGEFPANSYPATPKWNQYFEGGKAKGSTLTPKTDIIVGTDRISVKTGDAQLMSGGRSEALATFYTAAEKVERDTFVENLGKKLDGLMPTTDLTKLGIKGNKTELEDAGKFVEIEVLRRADEAHKALKEDLRALFKSNPAFAQEFTYEAMTGMQKFGNSEGTADAFLVTDFKGNAKMHRINGSSDSYVAKISQQVKPDAKFKTSQKTKAELKTPSNPKGKSGYYSFWSTIGLGINMVVKEEMNNVNSDEYLTEGIFDMFKWMKNVMKKALNFLKKYFNKIKKKLKENWSDVVAFLGFEIDITHNNKISW
jgi:hypothetical protein